MRGRVRVRFPLRPLEKFLTLFVRLYAAPCAVHESHWGIDFEL